VLVLDKNNSVEHLVRFKKLQDKVKNIQSRQNLMTRKERRETFLTIPYNEVISRYEAMFNLNIEEDEAVTDKHELKRIREERDRRKAALVRLGNMRNNIVHYFEYYFNPVDEGLFILNEILPFIREMIQEVSDAYKYEDIFNYVSQGSKCEYSKGGTPTNCTSNLRLGSTSVRALCIRRLIVQPLSNATNTVFREPGLKPIL